MRKSECQMRNVFNADCGIMSAELFYFGNAFIPHFTFRIPKSLNEYSQTQIPYRYLVLRLSC